MFFSQRNKDQWTLLDDGLAQSVEVLAIFRGNILRTNRCKAKTALQNYHVCVENLESKEFFHLLLRQDVLNESFQEQRQTSSIIILAMISVMAVLRRLPMALQ